MINLLSTRLSIFGYKLDQGTDRGVWAIAVETTQKFFSQQSQKLPLLVLATLQLALERLHNPTP